MVKLGSTIKVGTIPTQILITDVKRTSVALYNNDSSNIIYIGADRSVSTDNGFPIPPKTPAAFMVGMGDTPELGLYAVASGADTDLRIYEQYGFDPRLKIREEI